MGLERIWELMRTLFREIHDLPEDPVVKAGRTKQDGVYAELRVNGQPWLRSTQHEDLIPAIRGLAEKVCLEWMEHARKTGITNSVTARELTLALRG